MQATSPRRSTAIRRRQAAVYGIAVASIAMALLPDALSAAPARRAGGPHKTTTRPAPPHVIPASGVLHSDDLVAIAKLGAKASDDKFGDDPTVAYIGRQFELPIGHDELSIEYDKASQVLKVTLAPYSDSIRLAKEVKPSVYAGQNAYGAKATISAVRGNHYGIWLPGNRIQGHGIAFEQKLDGPSARALSGALQLRVSGTIVARENPRSDATPGSPVRRDSLISNATITAPLDVWIEGYFVTVAFSKVEWIDGRTGQVIRTDMVEPRT